MQRPSRHLAREDAGRATTSPRPYELTTTSHKHADGSYETGKTRTIHHRARNLGVPCAGLMHARQAKARGERTIKGAPEFRAPQPFPPQLGHPAPPPACHPPKRLTKRRGAAPGGARGSPPARAPSSPASVSDSPEYHARWSAGAVKFWAILMKIMSPFDTLIVLGS